jgi:hypothetical protein
VTWRVIPDGAEGPIAEALIELRRLEAEGQKPNADAAALACLGLGLVQESGAEPLAAMGGRHEEQVDEEPTPIAHAPQPADDRLAPRLLQQKSERRNWIGKSCALVVIGVQEPEDRLAMLGERSIERDDVGCHAATNQGIRTPILWQLTFALPIRMYPLL